MLPRSRQPNIWPVVFLGLRRWMTVFLLGLILVGMSLLSGGQNQPGASESDTPESTALKACSTRSPPPCATPPRATKSDPPHYPEEGRSKKIEAVADLWLIVDT